MSTSLISEWIEKQASQTEAAAALGVTQPLVSHWYRTGRVGAEHVLRVEGVTKISRHVLRPDVFGEKPEQAKAA